MNPENLKGHEFKPGESGNPTGRPIGARSLSTILREMLDEEIEIIDGATKTKKKFSDIIVRKLLKKANDGDIRAIQEIFDRMEGKAKQELQHTISEKQTFKIGDTEITFE